MKNWSGSQEYHPKQIAKPDSEEAIVTIVKDALAKGKVVRPVGSGHSFSPICVTEDTLLSLENYTGIVRVDTTTHEVRVRAGTTLKSLGELLFNHGLAMENLGDIDAQTIAGTISTGTHGTGRNFGIISTQVTALRFVNGQGKIINCSLKDKPELLKAAQVSLGLLGIITEITIACVPAYKLALQNAKAPLTEVLNTLEDRKQNNRNFECYWFPHTNTAWTKTSNLADEEADRNGWLHRVSEHVLENQVYGLLCEVERQIPALTKTIARISAAAAPTVRKVHHSHRVYATERLVRFNEMEYNIPAKALPEVIKEVQQTIRVQGFKVHMPIEIRFVARDDIYLSPAHQRDSAYIAFHVYGRKDYRPYFKAMEAICRSVDGRPHWGKLHTLTTEDVQKSYFKLPDFLEFRAAHDPAGIFLSPYFAKLFGLSTKRLSA
ncbi:MAG: D-arabinono-1,4-lactone oxidase [Bacteroidota bacterium]